MIPYIALQLKAVSVSFKMMIGGDSVLSGFDPTLLVAVTLGVFGILFGARNLDFTKHQTGLMTAVAVESIVKLVAFVLVGAFVTWGIFDGFSTIFARAAAHPQWSRLLVLDAPPVASYTRWSWSPCGSASSPSISRRPVSIRAGTRSSRWPRFRSSTGFPPRDT